MLVTIIPVRWFRVPNAGSIKKWLEIGCMDQSGPLVWAILDFKMLLTVLPASGHSGYMVLATRIHKLVTTTYVGIVNFY